MLHMLYRLSEFINRIYCNKYSANLNSKENIDYWNTLKDKHKNRRGFVIGNGPSLSSKDLDKIKDDISIASNKIYLIFNDTGWRPTYYSICDKVLAQKICSGLNSYVDIVHAPADLGISFKDCETRQWRALVAPKSIPKGNKTLFSRNALHGFHGGYSITYINIQLAAYLGLNPIYLLGCDHYYSGVNEDGRLRKIEVGENKNHFSAEYREPGELVNAAPISRMDTAYKHARVFLERKNIKIINTTRGGHLDIFVRKDLDDVLTNSNV